ncbi:hypothetical protein [Haloglycomyces albus]|uniref:hypothetical protein n=1 Tax=Haloglycomyces albus TaxID=526067 RepID=UPI0012EC6C37|nr:hypothetical protein [Haloglycomyces albus]
MHLQEAIALIDRVIGSDGVDMTSGVGDVRADRSVLSKILSYMDSKGMPMEVDFTFVVRPSWKLELGDNAEFARRLNPGTRVRTLCVPDDSLLGTSDEIPLELKPDLVHARTAWEPVPEFAIFDGKTALVKSCTGGEYSQVFTVEVPELIHSLSDLFERHWRLSLTPERYRRLKKALASPRCQQVICQLKEGSLDEVAARRIDVSVRTYRRYVATLMEILDVDTRFQVAWRLAQLT